MINSKYKPLDNNKALKLNLVDQVSFELRQIITTEEIKVGDKLPSEAALTKQFSVSRTVIREALAALRSDGLVESKQGAGVFVIENKGNISDGLTAVNIEKISSVIEMLELRTGVEVEAAGLAAIRRSPAQEDKIYQVLEDFITHARNDEPTSELDKSFHISIANATNNPRFAEILKLMGTNVIPRSSLQKETQETPSSLNSSKYLEQIHVEHIAIADAISQRDEIAAREAMRNHLMGSQNRYRTLLRNK